MPHDSGSIFYSVVYHPPPSSLVFLLLVNNQTALYYLNRFVNFVIAMHTKQQTKIFRKYSPSYNI